MLNIQKSILLLSDAHFKRFEKYLKDRGSKLSLHLIQRIRENNIEDQPEAETLCKMVYGDEGQDTKKKFFQLAHKTFQLTSYLNRNFPNHFYHNLDHIDHLMDQGRDEKALSLAGILLDMAIKTENFTLQINLHNFFSQRAIIHEEHKEALRQFEKLEDSIEYERLQTELFKYIRKHLSYKERENLNPKFTDEHLAYFERFFDHPTCSIQTLAKFGYCFTLSVLNDERFYNADTWSQIKALSKVPGKLGHISFPYADELLIYIDYLYLKRLLPYPEQQNKLLETASNVIQAWEKKRYWKNTFNPALVMALSIKASCYFTNTWRLHLKLTEKQRSELQNLQGTCEALLKEAEQWQDRPIKYINISNIYCIFLLFGPDKDKEEAVERIEQLLVQYQQIPFQKLYDAIFATLVIGLFSLSRHEAVNETYKRYEKLTANTATHQENDLTIKGVYYISQYWYTGRPQYEKKFNELMETVENDVHLKNTKVFFDRILEDLQKKGEKSGHSVPQRA